MATDEQIEREIQDKGLTAPRVTPESIAAKIVGEFYFTAEEGAFAAFANDSEIEQLTVAQAAANFHNLEEAHPSLQLLTFCVLVLANGFTVVGQSVPASAANFDAELGKKIARGDAVNKIWPLEGYLLRELLAEDDRREADQAEAAAERRAEGR